MSYLKKTIHSYWDLDEAVKEQKKRKNLRSNQKALDSLRSELDAFDNETSEKWKKEWKTMAASYVSKPPSQSSSSSTAQSDSSSSYANSSSSINIGQISSSNVTNQINNGGSSNNGNESSSSHANEQSQSSRESRRFIVDERVYNRVVEGSDLETNEILNKFLRFQKLSAVKSANNDFSVETNTQHIMALNNILLLKPDQACDDLRDIYPGNELATMLNYFKDRFNIGNEMLNETLERDLKKIIVDYMNNKTNNRQASKKIGNLVSETGNKAEDDVVIIIRNLVERLPKRKVSTVVQESNISTTYTDAIFRPLVEDPDNGNHLEWANTSANDSSLRPDFLGHSLHNIIWNSPTMIGEVKGADVSNDIHNNMIDLVRIGHFSKKSIDQNFYEGVLGIQIVGFQATVYLTSLVNSGLYIMLQICSFTMPKDLTQLRQFLSIIEDLLPIKSVYRDICKKTDDEVSHRLRIRSGLSDEAIVDLTNLSKNRKRPCPFINE